MKLTMLVFAVAIVLVAVCHGALTLIAAADRDAPLQLRCLSSAKTFVACAVAASGAGLALFASAAPIPGATLSIFAIVMVGSLAAAASFGVLGQAAARTGQQTYGPLLGLYARAAWSKSARYSRKLARAAIAHEPSPAFSNTRKHVNRVLVALSGFGVGVAAVDVMIYSSDVKPAGAMREFILFTLSILLLNATVPVLLTWFVLAFVNGRPNFARLLRQASDTVGIGVVLGLLCGVVAIWLNMLFVGRPLHDPSSFSFEVVIGSSLFGSIVGFGFAHVRVLRSVTQTFRNRFFSSVLTATVAIGFGAISTFAEPPRVIGERLIDALTQGVIVPAGVSATPLGSDNWRVAIAASHAPILESLPSAGSYVLDFAIAVLVVIVSGTIVDAVRSVRESTASRG